MSSQWDLLKHLSLSLVKEERFAIYVGKEPRRRFEGGTEAK